MKTALCTNYGPPEEMVVQEMPDLVVTMGKVAMTMKS